MRPGLNTAVGVELMARQVHLLVREISHMPFIRYTFVPLLPVPLISIAEPIELYVELYGHKIPSL